VEEKKRHDILSFVYRMSVDLYDNKKFIIYLITY
jgi:hypothetical protein